MPRDDPGMLYEVLGEKSKDYGRGAKVHVRTCLNHPLKRGPGCWKKSSGQLVARFLKYRQQLGTLHLHFTSEMAFSIKFNSTVMLCAFTSQWLSH